MKTLNRIFAVTVLAAFFAVAAFAQQQGAQTLSTTTLSAAITNVGAGNISSVTLASLSNVTATVSVGTTLWVDLEAMDVVTNSVPSSGTTILVQRGAHGTKAQGHASGRTVYVSRPNLFQGYDQGGTCWTAAAGTGLPVILPWINLTSGNRYDCKADGNWFRSGLGSQGSAAITAVNIYCTGIPAQNVAEYFNDTACTSATVATYSYTVANAGEVANLQIQGSAVAANANVIAVYKNGVVTTLTCTVAIAGKTCSDTTHGFAVSPGDFIQILDTVGNTTTETFANPSASMGIYGQ